MSDRVMQTVPNTLSETELNDTVTCCRAKHCISCQVVADAGALCLASRSPPEERTVSDDPCASLSGRRRTIVARSLCHVAGEYVQQSQNVAFSGSGDVPFSRCRKLRISLTMGRFLVSSWPLGPRSCRLDTANFCLPFTFCVVVPMSPPRAKRLILDMDPQLYSHCTSRQHHGGCRLRAKGKWTFL
jgi:hypothetical protein